MKQTERGAQDYNKDKISESDETTFTYISPGTSAWIK
jgi:hypothetical protein